MLYAVRPIPASVAYKSSRNIVFSRKYRVVWCPEHRQQVLVRGHWRA
ncbi:MAG TPA: hypothetical protein VMK12_26570 [Anaeromyxobacteraceae bacterium]|nr:hypothetical protein [Anaeromyxobacteraceae bacterium]